jgi:hypothetical protein
MRTCPLIVADLVFTIYGSPLSAQCYGHTLQGTQDQCQASLDASKAMVTRWSSACDRLVRLGLDRA